MFNRQVSMTEININETILQKIFQEHTHREREREREREKKKKKHSSTLIHDDFAWVAVQSRSLEQLMDQDSINIDNGENQANKRPWY